MKKSGLFFIALMVLAGLMAMGNTTTTQANGDHVIVIGVSPGNQYNETSFNLEKGVNYTIIFVNDDVGVGHNLRIDVNQDIEETANTGDSADKVIGEENDDPLGEGETNPPKMWTGYWVTPNEDTEVIYYCGYATHYSQGMDGTFIIGEGEKGGFLPGFNFIFAISALFVAATAITKFNKRN